MRFLKKRIHTSEAFLWAVNILSPLLYQDYVLSYFAKFSMTTLVNKKTQFKKFPCALLAIDMIFQQANCPSGNIIEGLVYFSGKHKLYGFKTEESVTPSGQEVNVTNHKPGSISDFVIFQDNMTSNDQVLKKWQRHRNC